MEVLLCYQVLSIALVGNTTKACYDNSCSTFFLSEPISDLTGVSLTAEFARCFMELKKRCVRVSSFLSKKCPKVTAFFIGLHFQVLGGGMGVQL